MPRIVPSGDKMPGVTDCSAFPIGRRESKAARPKISAAEKYAALNTISAMIEVGCDSIHKSIRYPGTGAGREYERLPAPQATDVIGLRQTRIAGCRRAALDFDHAVVVRGARWPSAFEAERPLRLGEVWVGKGGK